MLLFLRTLCVQLAGKDTIQSTRGNVPWERGGERFIQLQK